MISLASPLLVNSGLNVLPKYQPQSGKRITRIATVLTELESFQEQAQTLTGQEHSTEVVVLALLDPG